MGKLINLSGKKFGRLTVTPINESRRFKNCTKILWVCICDCGNKLSVASSALINGNSKSCGCLKAELIGNRRRKHGDSNSKEYHTWADIKGRCFNTRNHRYKYYGGRGIIVCDRWTNSFDNFLSDMGRAPSKKHSIDRINNNGHYEPSNCRWATHTDQCSNQRSNHLLWYNEELKPMSVWCRELNLNYFRIRGRIQRGWSVEDAFTKGRYYRGVNH